MNLPFLKKKNESGGEDLEEEDEFGDRAEAGEDRDDEDLEEEDEFGDQAEAGDERDDEGRREKRQIAVLIGAGAVIALVVVGVASVIFLDSGDDTASAPAAPVKGPSASLDLPPPPGAGLSGEQSLNSLAAGEAGLTKQQAAEAVAARTASKDRESPVGVAGAAAVRKFLTEDEISPSQEALQNQRGLGLSSTGGNNNPDRARVVPFVSPAAFQGIPALPDPEDGGLGRVPELDLLDEDKQDETRLPKLGRGGRRAMDVYARPAEVEDGVPAVALMVTDVGLSRAGSLAAINTLPPEISMIVSPYARDPEDWVLRARLKGHEVFLALPMESSEFPLIDAGPLALKSSLQLEENKRNMYAVMSRITGYVGLVTQLGSSFGVAEGQLLPLMEELRDRGVMLVDGGQTGATALSRIAGEVRLPRSINNMFLDNSPTPIGVKGQLARLEVFAQSQSVVIATFRPRPLSIKHVLRWIRQLRGKNIQLIPVSATANLQGGQ